ncbi:MAG: Lipid carrier : UDP-N-acetylgalactosaminyltransferase (EC / Alpha-1,3-N-acetylgalactosamine transferase PglA (EC; Putative glycosyltransferase [uncultured Aureispira sp.]|uniref:Lipid carrier: UDP-N-acetylgalactosaminyltransferase ) n=1 Tax=uncultured Aureispira sp. TaxID=1331704 RepID=A0A6S6SKM2_9BACT|nr:MAG: Lipid carrier : UDP-N-acetylgalactosaminyltransferase (EC / Alpha-1,3-N-acetylgalactosamine transferase PglA (EC; Putative glycosyltransferase [uncultured Aureispira sp.]
MNTLKQQQLKIGIVLNTAWNIYNFRLGLVNAFLAAGHQVYAIAPVDDFVSEIEATGCTFIPVHHLSRKGMNPIQDLRFGYELYKIYQSKDLDVVLHYTIKPNIYGCLAAGRAKVKSISTVTGLGYSFLKEGLVNKIANRLYQMAFKSGTRIAFQNRDDKKLFEDLSLCPASKTTLIKGSGINTTHFKPMPKKKTYEKLIYLFVGRLLYDKGVTELFEAAQQFKKQCPETEIWVVGAIDDGNPSAVAKAEVEAQEANGTIRYWGVSKDVRSIMQEADVVVLPSYREGLPRVMLESLAMGKPIITTDTAGCRETIRDTKNGFIVPVKDAAALANAMFRMYQLSDEARQEMGRFGREMALQEFDEQAIIKRYFEEIAAMF